MPLPNRGCPKTECMDIYNILHSDAHLGCQALVLHDGSLEALECGRRPTRGGLEKGVSAPELFATSAIAGSSVETTTRWNKPDLNALSIAQAIMGLPQKSLIFFLGRRLLPPLAGITAMSIVDSGQC